MRGGIGTGGVEEGWVRVWVFFGLRWIDWIGLWRCVCVCVCMRRLKREVALLGERAAGLMQAR